MQNWILLPFHEKNVFQIAAILALHPLRDAYHLVLKLDQIIQIVVHVSTKIFQIIGWWPHKKIQRHQKQHQSRNQSHNLKCVVKHVLQLVKHVKKDKQ